MDAKRKDARRKELDVAITEVKTELKDLEQREREREERVRGTSHESGEVLDRRKPRWRDILKLRPEDVDERWTTGNLGLAVIPPGLHRQLSEAQVEQILTSDQLLELLGGGWKMHPARKGFMRDGHCPSETTTDSLCVLSPKKLMTLELSIAKLALRFLAHISSVQDQKPPNVGVPQDFSNRPATHQHDLWLKIAKMNRYLQRLRSNENSTHKTIHDWPASPAYDRDNFSTDDQQKLNAGLCSIFEQQARSKDITLMLENICSLLLLAPSPPNVTTYNLLITHLTHLQQNELVKMVLESFNESHIRPNEITITATLKFLTVSNDRRGFRGYVNRLRGRHGGLMLARPDIKVTAAAEGRLIRRKTKVIQEAPKNIHVFGALIQGTLKFCGVKRGMIVYYEMLKEGWEPNMQILAAILRRCHLNRDWDGGYAVWRHIKETSQYISYRAYLWMLQLCQICKRQEIYDEILKELNSQGLSLDHLQQYFMDKRTLLPPDNSVDPDIRSLRRLMRKQRREAVKVVKAFANDPAIDPEQDAHNNGTDEAAEAFEAEEQNNASLAPLKRSHKVVVRSRALESYLLRIEAGNTGTALAENGPWA